MTSSTTSDGVPIDRIETLTYRFPPIFPNQLGRWGVYGACGIAFLPSVLEEKLAGSQAAR